MKTFTLDEAANFLKMKPEAVRLKAKNGEVPGAKPGKRWVFREDHLAEYLQSLYSKPANALQGVIKIDRRKTWHSTKEVTHGGSQFATKDLAYKKVVGLPIS